MLVAAEGQAVMEDEDRVADAQTEAKLENIPMQEEGETVFYSNNLGGNQGT